MHWSKTLLCSSGTAMQGFSTAFMLAAVLITGCTSTGQSIQAVDSKFRTLEVQAREDMLLGRHASADANYATAAAQIDQTTETYVDGYFYLDHARMAGNRAFMALLDGDQRTAREHFSSSVDYLTSGIRAHEEVLRKREASRKTALNVVGAAAVFGVVNRGSRGVADATSLEEGEAILDATIATMELLFDLIDSISEQIEEVGSINVHEEAKYVDPDVWRAALISDHPLSQAVVRVYSGDMKDTYSCTGFFIQPRLIATSAHCLNEQDTGDVRVEVRKPREEKEPFLLGKSVKRLNVETVHWPRTYEWVESCHPDDVALLVVSEDDRSDQWLPVDTRPVVGGSKALLIGYSGDLDRGFFQRMDYGCKLARDDRRRMIGSTCAGYPGNSGGPLLSIDYNRAGTPFRVVGVLSCGSEEYRGKRTPGISKWAAGIAPLKRLVRSTIAKQPSLGDPQLFQ